MSKPFICGFPPEMEERKMGSLTHMRARTRLQTALEQRLAIADTPAAKRTVYQDAVNRLARIAIDAAELDRVAWALAVTPESIAFPGQPADQEPSVEVLSPCASATSDAGGEAALEPTVDLAAAGWEPGEPCPACEHLIVHAIVRAGMQFHADGRWDYDETLAIYEAFCPECDWLPPVTEGPTPRIADP